MILENKKKRIKCAIWKTCEAEFIPCRHSSEMLRETVETHSSVGVHFSNRNVTMGNVTRVLAAFVTREAPKSLKALESSNFSFPQCLEGPTRKPRHATAFLARTPTRKRFPAFHCIRMFKGILSRHARFKTHRLAVYHCLKEVQKPFRHPSVFKTRVSTRACPFLKRAFSPI